MPVARWTRVARAGVAGALMLATAGCREDVAAPPSGLPVTLTASAPSAAPVPAPTITAAGDSAVAVAVVGIGGCVRVGATAGRAGGALVLTITATEVNEVCTGDPIGVTYRVVAHRAPRGQYDVVLRQQHIRLEGHALPPAEIVRQTVTVP